MPDSNITENEQDVDTGSSNETDDAVSFEEDLLAAAALFDDSIDNYSPLSSTALTKTTTKLFGLPYQFSRTVDPRIYSKTNWEESLNACFGRHFLTYFMIGAPILTIIPGKPKYEKSVSLQQMMLEKAGGDTESSNNFAKLIDFNNNTDTEKRFYSFEQDYRNYFAYVNVLCRACAIFMEIGDITGPGMNKPYAQYDWKNYRVDGSSYSDSLVDGVKKIKALALTKVVDAVEPIVGSVYQFKGTLSGWANQTKNDLKSVYDNITDIFDFNKDVDSDNIASDVNDDTVTESSTQSDGEENESSSDGTIRPSIDYNNIEELFQQHNYVQFYIDPSSSQVNESLTNQVGESKFESTQAYVSDIAKEIGFLINSGGIDSTSQAVADYVEEGLDSLENAISENSNNGLTSMFSTLLGSFNSALKGEQIAFPKIWKASEFEKSYTIKIKLRSVYGHREARYLDVLVPFLHLLAMAMPRQSTTNSYGSPFILQMYYPGIFSCNMGMIQSIEIDRHQTDSSWTIDGYPNEVDVTLNVTDLYSDLAMSSGNDPDLFINNDNLLAYLGTLCGIDYTAPNIALRQSLYLTTKTLAGQAEGASATVGRMVNQYISNLVDDARQYYSIG